MKEQLLTVSEASDYLNTSASTVYRYSKRRMLPHFKTGFGLRFKIGDLDEFLHQYKREAFFNSDILELNGPLTIPFAGYIDKAKGGNKDLAKPKKSRQNYGYGAVYIRKTKSGKIRWYIDYKDQTGCRKQTVVSHATTFEEALIALKKQVEKVFDANYGIQRKRERIRFKEFSEIYIRDYAMVQKPKSWKSTDAWYVEPMRKFFGDIDLREITPLMIQQFRASRLKIGNEKSTSNRYLACLKKMLNVAIEEGYLVSNPAMRVKMYSEKENIRTRVLSEDEEKKLLEASAEHLRPIILVALHTGMRLNKILTLKWGHVDFRRKEIRVEKTKNEKPRYIPINSDLMSVFGGLKSQNGSCVYVFPNPKTGKPRTSVKTAFNASKRRAEIQNFRFHDLRHTAGSRLVEAGVDLITVKELFGHSSVKVTERYTHSHKEQKERAVELLVKRQHEKTLKRDNLLHICDMEEHGLITPSPNVSKQIN